MRGMQRPAVIGAGQWNTAELTSIMQNLTGPSIRADDPRVLHVLRNNVIEPPSFLIPKFSYPLFQTEQAKAVDKILKNKVREW